MTATRRVRLDEIAEVTAGNPAPQGCDAFAADGPLFIRMQDVGREHHTRSLVTSVDRLAPGTAERLRLRRFPKGTLLVPKSGASVNLNHRALLGVDAYVVSHLATVVPNEAVVNPEYLYYWSLTYDPRHQAQTTSLPSLPISLVKAVEVPLPSLDEQRRIVDILSRAEGLVRLRREAETKAKEMIPALFSDMFGDPASNPKEWPLRPLREVANVGSGNGFPTALQGRIAGDFPFYKVSDMNEIGNEVEMVRANNYIDRDVREKLRATVFPPGTVVFPKIGAAIATNKKRLLTLPSCVDNNVGAIVPTGEILPTYLHALIMAKNLSDFASDSNPPSIRKTTVEQWQIPVPPLDVQRAFAEQRAAMIAVDQQQRVAFQCAENIFAALLSRTFSAETT